MSSETERIVGRLLDSSQGSVPANCSSTSSAQGVKQALSDGNTLNSVSVPGTNPDKEKLNKELKEQQEKMKA